MSQVWRQPTEQNIGAGLLLISAVHYCKNVARLFLKKHTQQKVNAITVLDLSNNEYIKSTHRCPQNKLYLGRIVRSANREIFAETQRDQLKKKY